MSSGPTFKWPLSAEKPEMPEPQMPERRSVEAVQSMARIAGPGAPATIRRIVLTGFMGAGKTTVGNLLATRLAWSFVDADERIEAAAGATIAQLFMDRGEPWFRQLEHETIRQLMNAPSLVLALGGGAIEDERTLNLLLSSSGTQLIHLEASLETVLQRCRRALEFLFLPTFSHASLPVARHLWCNRRPRRVHAHRVSCRERPALRDHLARAHTLRNHDEANILAHVMLASEIICDDRWPRDVRASGDQPDGCVPTWSGRSTSIPRRYAISPTQAPIHLPQVLFCKYASNAMSLHRS